MMEEIDLDEILLRAIKRKWLQWNEKEQIVQVSFAAFLLRENEDGLSVGRSSFMVGDQSFPGFPAVCSGPAAGVFDLGLSVTPKKHDPTAADIMGLPEYGDDQANSCARDLLNVFRGWARKPSNSELQKAKERAPRQPVQSEV